MQRRAFGKRMPATLSSLPPLTKARKRRVVQGHLDRHTPHPPTRLAQSHTEFRLFTGDHVSTKTTHCRQRRRAHHSIAPARSHIARWRVPLDVAQPVVQRVLGMPLAPATAYDRNIRVIPEAGQCRGRKARFHLTVAIDEEHGLQLRGHLAKPLKAGIAGTRSGEGQTHVEIDDERALRTRECRRSVGRS